MPRAAVLAIAALALLVAPATAQAPATTYDLPGDRVFPEGVATDGERYWVSSSRDGTIFRGRLDQPRAEVFLEPGADGRTAALGLFERRGRLYVAGRDTGFVWVYDGDSGRRLARFSLRTARPAFLNDLTVTAGGDTYVTDSVRPLLFRIRAGARPGRVRPWLDLRRTPVRYKTGAGPAGTNFNGIAVAAGGRALIAAQTNAGRLWRIDLRTRRVTRLRVQGGEVTFPDGLAVRGRTLYAVRNGYEVAVLRLSTDAGTATFVRAVRDPSFHFPTTVAATDDRLLVVNSQFDRQGGAPDLPFRVTSIPLP